MPGTALILGASGRFGRNAVEAYWNACWRVQTFDRTREDLIAAAGGVDVIVNGWNPAYSDWERELPKLTGQVIAAAQASGATVLIPGNVYGYGEGSGPRLTSETPKTATNPLGRIRNRMEDAYRDASVQTIILRAGDFIDTEVSGNWFESHITRKAAKGILVAPGDPDVPHAWAYLPDVAQAAVLLAEERDRLDVFEEILFPGYALSLRDIQELVGRAIGRDMRVRRFPWWLIRAAAPFWPMGRHLLEMRFLWLMPHTLDGSRIADLLPSFRATDPLSAVSRSLGVDRDVQPNQAVTGSAFHVAAEWVRARRPKHTRIQDVEQ